MGTDIHWAVERLDSDGTWKAVMTKARMYQIEGAPQNFDLTSDEITIGMQLGFRNYARFYVLSGLRGDDEPDAYIAKEGHPDNLSETVYNYIGEPDDDLHSQGHFTLGHLRNVIAENDPELFPEEDLYLEAEWYLKQVEALVGTENLMNQVLTGRTYGEIGNKYPDMENSRHAAIERVRAAEGLLPPGDNTVRFIIAYDN